MVTSVKEAAAKLRSGLYSEFEFPLTGIVAKVRRVDVVHASVTHQLPTFLAENVLSAIKGQSKEIEAAELSDEALIDFIQKGRRLMISHVIEPKFADKGDDENTLTVSDMPSMDVLAFVQWLISDKTRVMETKGGDVLAEADVIKFPVSGTGDERDTTGSDGEGVRAAS